MEALLTEDYKQDHAVPREGDDVQKTKRNGDPDLGCSQAWDSHQEEGHRLSIGIIEDQHSEGLRRQECLNN